MIKAVFFDFWGTLVENGTYSPMRQTYNLLRLRMRFGEFVQKFEDVVMTRPFEDLTEAFTNACEAFDIEPKPFIIEKLVGIWNKNKLLASPYPDTVDTLKALKEKGLKIILVSNTLHGTVPPILERFEIKNLFDKLFISADTGSLKNTGLFDLALKKSRLKPDEVLSVGDSIESDIKGAESAGIKAILIDRKDRREFDNKIVSLNEILKLLEA